MDTTDKLWVTIFALFFAFIFSFLALMATGIGTTPKNYQIPIQLPNGTDTINVWGGTYNTVPATTNPEGELKTTNQNLTVTLTVKSFWFVDSARIDVTCYHTEGIYRTTITTIHYDLTLFEDGTFRVNIL
jgi:hypothetical protein